MDPQILIDQITKLCDQNSITTKQMLKEVKINKSLVYNLKKGSLPTINKIEAIADYFNVSIDYLIGRVNLPNKSPDNTLVPQIATTTQESKHNFYTHLESTIFTPDLILHRRLHQDNSKNGEKNACDYEYAVGYKTTLHNKEIKQSIFLIPLSSEGYKLLDAIFGESDKKQVDIIRNTYTYNLNDQNKITHTYNFRVSTKSQEEIELICNLKPVKGYQDQFDNLISMLKKYEIIY